MTTLSLWCRELRYTAGCLIPDLSCKFSVGSALCHTIYKSIHYSVSRAPLLRPFRTKFSFMCLSKDGWIPKNYLWSVPSTQTWTCILWFSWLIPIRTISSNEKVSSTYYLLIHPVVPTIYFINEHFIMNLMNPSTWKRRNLISRTLWP